MKQDRGSRLGLSESLEQFSSRMHSTPDKCRISWRLQGLRALLPIDYQITPWTDMVPIVSNPGLRIAPGIRVPTKSAGYVHGE